MICFFTTDSYSRFTKRTFWFEANVKLTLFLFGLETLLEKKYIPLFSVIYSCTVVITGLKNLKALQMHRLKYTHRVVKEDNIFCLKKWNLSYYLSMQSFSYPQGLPGIAQRILNAVFSISMLVFYWPHPQYYHIEILFCPLQRPVMLLSFNFIINTPACILYTLLNNNL